MGGRTNSLESVASLRRALARLERKVSRLEKVLAPGTSRAPASREHLRAGYADELHRARREALDDFEHQERLAMYRTTPGMVEQMRELERRRNAFLDERGLPPEPTRIPREILEEHERAARGLTRQARHIRSRTSLASSP